MHVPAWLIWNMKSLLACMFWMYAWCMAARWSERLHVCVCARKRETAEGEREFVTSKISEEQSRASAQWSDSWTYQLAAVYVQLCAHVHTHKVPMGAFMNVVKLSIWDRLSLQGKWTNQTDSNQLKTSTHGLPVGRGRVPAGAKGTNNILTHKTTCSLNETIYQIAYAKVAMACAEYHVRKRLSKCDAAGHFHRATGTARDKTLTAAIYEDNEQKKMEGKGIKSATEGRINGE